MEQFDVAVIGAGHAGLEAAAAASRLGCRVALVTLGPDDLGALSCNPAIGGVGKGHLVREIDALDGLMGRLGDAAAIQYRLLNASKGPAVQGPRTQTDRALYRRAVAAALQADNNITLVCDEAVDLDMHGTAITGVVLASGQRIAVSAVVLATGTFLGGQIHIGADTRPAGRWGGATARRLAEFLAGLGLQRGRLKTGTPPRLDGRTIAWDLLASQPGDAAPSFLSFATRSAQNPQIACGVTATTPQTHAIIQRNLHLSAIHAGEISGPGPRYCPSIEDKVVRFAEKSGHNVFLEPEGLGDTTVYPNGVSTSLPPDVQAAFLHSMPGLEKVCVLRPGYAVEYDYFDPRGLARSLAVTGVSGLFFAGQINGTTGYEEAGAQGLVAGLNAARMSKDLEATEFGRETSYIGVMLDDLVSRGVTEPYRMFTSRAEFRLSLRADNADRRLTPLGLDLGCIGEDRRRFFEDKLERLERLQEQLAGTSVPTGEGAEKRTRPALELLALDEGEALLRARGLYPQELDPAEAATLRADALYAPFLARQSAERARLRQGRQVRLGRLDEVLQLSGLSHELRGKLRQARPRTLAEAEAIEGMTPAALALLLLHARGDAVGCST